MNKKNFINFFRIPGLILIFLSAGLLIRELLQYNTLPSMKDPVLELVDFSKYKENVFNNSIVWSIFLVLGFSIYLGSKKVKE